MSTLEVNPPDAVFPMDQANGFVRSWGGTTAHLNAEHSTIFSATESLPGWQHIHDTEKLYEMAFRNGAVILEIGTYGGRSATVELRGAIAGTAATAKGWVPQFFGVDVDAHSIARTHDTLLKQGLSEHALLFGGNLSDFRRAIPITPTMVFVDGDHRYAGVWTDLRLLTEFLAPGTPVLCHDFVGIADVERAIREWVASGYYEPMGQFGCSALLRTTAKCSGRPMGLPTDVFNKVREDLIIQYVAADGQPRMTIEKHRIAQATEPARQACLARRKASQPASRYGWPYVNTNRRELPDCLPGGRPWPKISVVTPSNNYGRYLEECILSIRNQGYPHVEHIVIDGGSNDGTREVIDRYRDGLAYAVSEKDGGQSDAINKGFAKATGELFAWINADDMLAPGALHAMALAFHQSGADMVAGICERHREGRLIDKHMTSCADGPLRVAELLDIEGRWVRGQFFMQPEVMFTRELWEKAGGHVEVGLHYSMDYELWLRFAAADARLHVIGRSICWFRLHHEQKTASLEKFMPELLNVRDAYVARLGIAPDLYGMQGEPREKLRIVSVNDLGFQYGAGIGQRRLLNALAAGGHQVFAYAATDRAGSADAATAEEVVEIVDRMAPDVVLVGNVHGASLSPDIAGMMAQRRPTAVVLHDLWFLTGRCAYPGGCEKYLTGCDAECPTADVYPVLPRAQIHAAWDAKYHAYAAERRPIFLANSRWMAERATAALGARSEGGKTTASISTVRFGVERDVFNPRDKAACRRELKLPEDRFLILTSASGIEDPRKGVALLAEALKKLALPDVVLVCLGRAQDETRLGIPNVRMLGYVQDPQELAKVYSAADVFVGPSLEEAFGQVFTEAAACGTPSIAFPVGGMPEAVVNGVNGVIAFSPTADSLAESIFELYSNHRLRHSLGAWGQLLVENEWSVEKAYHDLQVAFRQSGLLRDLGYAPKIRFIPQPFPVTSPVNLGLGRGQWQAVSGFASWEGPYPDQGLPRCRWMLGPISKVQVNVPSAGRYQVKLVCTTFEPLATVRIVHGDKIFMEGCVKRRTETEPSTTLTCDVDFEQTSSLLEIHHWPWQPAENSRNVSVLLFELSLSNYCGRGLSTHEKPDPYYSAAARD